MIVKERTLNEIDSDLWILEHRVKVLKEKVITVTSFILTIIFTMIFLFIVVALFVR